VKLNELNLSHVLGDYGAAAVKQVGNRIAGNAEGNLSVQDKIAKEKFISNFIGRASTSLNSAIQSGLVDPNMKATPAGGSAGPAQGGETPPSAPADSGQTHVLANPKTPTTGQAPGGKPSTPADPGQTHVLANPKTPGGTTPAGGATPQGGTANPTPAGGATPPGQAPGATGQTPGQAPGGPKTPEQIRKEKQAAAGLAAQQNMASNTATSSGT
jgi:hypothetical protein